MTRITECVEEVLDSQTHYMNHNEREFSTLHLE